MRTAAGGLILLFLSAAAALPQTSAVEAAREWRRTHERAILDEFVELLSIPNIARDLPNIRRNAELLSRMLERRGVAARLLQVPGAPPAVFGELNSPGATQTLVFYAHYDGQPVEPDQWATGDPFRPVLFSAPLDAGGKPVPLPARGEAADPEWRLYARSASDDKAPVIALLSALDALRAARNPLRSNIRFFFEGEEEAGSPHLERILREHKTLLAADLWIFCDGPVHQSRRQQIVFGARGSTNLEITVYGPRREVHSGHYGNWAPNPAMLLAQLLASTKDEKGRVLVQGFYDDVAPLGETEKRAIAEAPAIDDAIRRELWLGGTEGAAERLEERIQMPALNIHGLASASVGELARNVIPSSATASLGIRLVKGMDRHRTVERVLEHIRRKEFHITETEPSEDLRLAHARICRVRRRAGYNAMRTSMDLPIAQRVVRAVEQATGPAVKLPTMGGSLPLSIFQEVLGAPVIIVPIANHDNNQHGHNENIRLKNLWDGIDTMAALLALENK